MEGNGFVLATGDVGALRSRPSESGILAQRMVIPLLRAIRDGRSVYHKAEGCNSDSDCRARVAIGSCMTWCW